MGVLLHSNVYGSIQASRLFGSKKVLRGSRMAAIWAPIDGALGESLVVALVDLELVVARRTFAPEEALVVCRKRYLGHESMLREANTAHTRRSAQAGPIPEPVCVEVFSVVIGRHHGDT